MRLRDRYFLWRNGYCTKHLVPKEFHLEFSWCNQCDEERRARKELAIKSVISRVELILKEERK